MSNLKDWILSAAKDESIIAVVIGQELPDNCPKCHKYFYSYDNICRDCSYTINICIPILTWEEAMPKLDKEFDSGFGSVGCPAIYAYTPNWVIFVSQYDGSTSIKRIPRNPTANINPIMPGGG